MYELLNPLEEVNLELWEYAYLTIDTKHYSQYFKIYLPKLMAGFPFGDPKGWEVPISTKSNLSNASQCKPSMSTTLPVQNYITSERHLDRSFAERADYKNDLVKGQQFIISFMNHNPRLHRIGEIL